MEQKQNDKEMENSLLAGNVVVVNDRYRNDRFFVWYNDAYRMVLCSRIAWSETRSIWQAGFPCESRLQGRRLLPFSFFRKGERFV